MIEPDYSGQLQICQNPTCDDTKACKGSCFGTLCYSRFPSNCLPGAQEESSYVKTTGNCISCIIGFYGDKCDLTCSKLCEAALGCVQSVGDCKVCKQLGYYGLRCTTTCPITVM